VAVILSHNPPFGIMMACPSQAIFEWNQTNYRYKPYLLLIHSNWSLYIVDAKRGTAGCEQSFHRYHTQGNNWWAWRRRTSGTEEATKAIEDLLLEFTPTTDLLGVLLFRWSCTFPSFILCSCTLQSANKWLPSGVRKRNMLNVFRIFLEWTIFILLLVTLGYNCQCFDVQEEQLPWNCFISTWQDSVTRINNASLGSSQDHLLVKFTSRHSCKLNTGLLLCWCQCTGLVKPSSRYPAK